MCHLLAFLTTISIQGARWGLRPPHVPPAPRVWAVIAGEIVVGTWQLKVCELKSRKRAEAMKASRRKRILIKGNL